jgi:DNA-binding transcriptional LysR family regulator
MDLPQISHFLVLARLLNFTRAAEECRITQPAFSRSVRRLELELGGDLVLRERSLTQLTKFVRGGRRQSGSTPISFPGGGPPSPWA